MTEEETMQKDERLEALPPNIMKLKAKAKVEAEKRQTMIDAVQVENELKKQSSISLEQVIQFMLKEMQSMKADLAEIKTILRYLAPQR